MSVQRLSLSAALAIAEATLAAARPGEVILSAFADDDGVAVGYGYAEDIIAVGNGPLLVDRRTGEVRFLGSIEQLDRLDAMTEVPL